MEINCDKLLSVYQTQYLFFSGLAILMSIVGSITIYKKYQRFKGKALVYLDIILIFLTLFSVCHTMIYVVGFENSQLMILLFRTQIFLLFVVVSFLILFVESLRVEKPSPILTMILGIGVGNGIIVGTMPDAIEFDALIGPYLSDFARIVFGIDLIILLLLMSLQIYFFIPYTPKSFSKAAYLFYFGCLSPILLPALLIVTKLSLVIGGIEILGLAIGIITVVLAIQIDDRVLRITPFNVYRLAVININMGLSIFDVLFNPEHLERDPDASILIPYLMTANYQFVQSAIHDTEKIRSIETENYIFLFCTYKDLVTFIFADRMSLLLRDSLIEFTKRFHSEFKDNIDSPEVGQYKEAGKLLEIYFSFLPSFKITSLGT